MRCTTWARTATAFSGTAVTATFEPFGVPDGLPMDMATGLYCITQELLSNGLKHAQASTVEVQLLGNRGHVVLIVQDNGHGMGTTKAAPGIGLLNIADRARALNGTFALESTPGQGTAATVRMPMDGYLVKNCGRDELMHALRARHAGQRHIASALVEGLLERRQERRLQSELIRDLSEREVEVLAALAEGSATRRSATGSSSARAPWIRTTPTG